MFYQNDKFINDFIEIIKQCNKIVLDVYNSDFNVSLKTDESPLTLADKKCNEHICNYLEKLSIPNSYIISEENKNKSFHDRKNFEYIWLVDPLDGTKEFVKRNGQFTINIGLCKNKIPIFGIVSIPVTGEIYYGVEGIGSFKIQKNNKIKLEISNKDMNKEGMKIVASSSHMNEETKNFINKFKNPEIINTGSSIKLLFIAENKADLYPRIAPTSEWDTCAAHAVVKYANGNVFQYNKNIELEYNKENLLNPPFIVY